MTAAGRVEGDFDIFAGKFGNINQHAPSFQKSNESSKNEPARAQPCTRAGHCTGRQSCQRGHVHQGGTINTGPLPLAAHSQNRSGDGTWATLGLGRVELTEGVQGTAPYTSRKSKS